jgi:hypothetical protein
MSRTRRVLESLVILVALLSLGGAVTADVENADLVGTWAIDFDTMATALGPEYMSGADATLTDNSVTMVFNSDNSGSQTQTLSGTTEVVTGTWTVTNIVGDSCDVQIVWTGDHSGDETFTYTFIDADTINFTQLGLPTPVVMRRQP